MNQKEREILGKYAHWQAVLGAHGLKAPDTIEEFLEVNSCDGVGGCVADVCSGGNGEGCLADTCSADTGDKHKKYIKTLIEERRAKLAGDNT